jgi:subtilisin family serine protease
VQLHPVLTLEAQLDDSVPHIGAGSALEAAGIDGTGVDVGVIDCGVDYLHAAFGGVAEDNAYALNDGTTIADNYKNQPLFPTARIVGGIDLAGAGYDPKSGTPPSPDPDPMPEYVLVDGLPEYADHGTHVAGIVGGQGSTSGPPGVAPGARLWAIKVSSLSSTTLTTAGIEWALDPDQDGDLSDALDVLNISLGSSFSGGGMSANSAEALAVEAFVDHGGVVVCSVGNSGNVPMAASSPAAIPSTIAVAATRAPGEVGTFVQVTQPPSLVGLYPARPASTKLAPTFKNMGTVMGYLVYVGGQGCDPGAYGPDVDGAVALIERKGCKFGEKFANAQAAGAIALITIHHKPGAAKLMSGEPKAAIPGAMIEQAAGNAFKDALEAGETIKVTIGSDFPVDQLIDTIWSQSSRGPAIPFWSSGLAVTVKPDLSAPGANIASAKPGLGSEMRVASGTSMAAPHVAGVAALMKQEHPNWTAREIKAALINTASPAVYLVSNPLHGGDGEAAEGSRAGAGRVDVNAALATDVVAFGGPQVALNFGVLSETEATLLEQSLTVVNKGQSSRQYALSVKVRGDDGSDRGVNFSLDRETLQLEPGADASVMVSVQLDPAKWPIWQSANLTPSTSNTQKGSLISGAEFDGHVVLTPDDDSPVIRIPIYLLAKRPSGVEAGSVCFSKEPFVIPLTDSLAAGESDKSQVELFTLADEKDKDELASPGSDVRVLGVRTATLKEKAIVQFALSTWAPRVHPSDLTVHIFIDTDSDGFADYILMGQDDGITIKRKISGRMGSTLLRVEGKGNAKLSVKTMMGTFELAYKTYAVTDLMSANLILTARLTDLGVGEDNPAFRYWVVVYDQSGLADLLPSNVSPWDPMHSKAYYFFSLGCSEWVFDQPTLSTAESWEALVSQSPSCGLVETAQGVNPPGILVLTRNKPGESEALVLHADASALFTCPQNAAVEVEPTGCVAAPDYGSLVAPGCGEYVTASGPGNLNLGEHSVSIPHHDSWGRGGLCRSTLTVVDSTAPTLDCPQPVLHVLPDGPTSFDFAAADSCSFSVEIEQVGCKDDEGEESDACEAELDGKMVTVSGFTANAKSLHITLRAEDGSGNVTLKECSMTLSHPPADDGGGCQSTPRPRPAPPLILVTFLLLMFVRRFTCA